MYLFFPSLFQERSREDEELISLAEGILTLRMILIASSSKVTEDESTVAKEKGISHFRANYSMLFFHILDGDLLNSALLV